MNNPSDKTTILKDTAVFEFVSGSLSADAHENFEKLVEQDPALRREVEAEIALRTALEQVHDVGQQQVAPVSMNNFDALLERIDALEADDELGENRAPVISINDYWKRSLSVAASLALVAVFGAAYFSQLTEPEFETLSNQNAGSEVNFPLLVEQGRIAKVVLADHLSSEEVEVFLERYKLNIINAGSQQTVLYVSAQKEIDLITLQEWHADSRVNSVDVVSYGERNK